MKSFDFNRRIKMAIYHKTDWIVVHGAIQLFIMFALFVIHLSWHCRTGLNRKWYAKPR